MARNIFSMMYGLCAWPLLIGLVAAQPFRFDAQQLTTQLEVGYAVRALDVNRGW